ncbi:hypothetical protein [Sphingopyxis sp. NJF-3]
MIVQLEKIRRLLWDEWDPIGVNGIAPDDEYDSYAHRVYAMLGEGKQVGEIADYLTWAVCENMGMGGVGRDEAIASDARAIALKIVAIGEDEE